MGKLTLYGTNISPPVRAVLLTLKALKLPYEFVEINLFERDQDKPEYTKKNPQHTVPTLEDDGEYICDSHAINAYLVEKYAESDDLYPKDLLKRILVIERLQIESGAIFCNVYQRISRMTLFEDKKILSKEKLLAIFEVYKLVDEFVKDQPYVAGDTLTIADFSVLSTVSSLHAFFGIYEPQFLNLWAWMKRMQELPYYAEANGKGIKELLDIIKLKRIVFNFK